MNRACTVHRVFSPVNFLLRFSVWFFLLCAAALARSTQNSDKDKGIVAGTLTEQGKSVPGGLVVLQRLKDAGCAHLFISGDTSEKARKKAESCTSDLPDSNTDVNGAYSYQQLEPGWYDIRFLWSMANAPSPGSAIACKGDDWVIFYEPERDRTGKYDAMVQGMPFELKPGETRQVSFDYRNQFEATGCMRRFVDLPSPPKTGLARISIPGRSGVLEIDPGPSPWQTKLQEEGSEIYFTALGRSDHLLVTAFLQRVPFPATAETCRDARWPNEQGALRWHHVDLGHINKTTQNGVARVEFFVERSPGGKLEMKDVHTYMGEGSLCVEVHLSKVFFRPDEQKLFDEVLNSVRFFPYESAQAPAQPK